jgi:hypothetical protein
MSDIFREVDEALQKEKVEKIWKEYGPVLITAAIVLVLSTAASVAYRTWDSNQNKQETARLVEAMNDTDLTAAMEKVAGETRRGHEGIALLTAAAKHAENKDFAKAADLYKQLIDDRSAPKMLSGLATVLYVRAVQLNAGEVDYNALLEVVRPVAQDKKNPFQLQAKVEAALLYGDGLKDYTAALKLLEGFEKEAAPESLKEKALALKHVYEFESRQTPKA